MPRTVVWLRGAGGRFDVLLPVLQSGDAFIRCCAARALARRGEPFPIAPFDEWEQMDDNGQIEAAIAALLELADARSMPALIHALHYQNFHPSYAGDNTPSMRERVVTTLLTLTGEDFGYDVAMWEQWAAQRAGNRC